MAHPEIDNRTPFALSFTFASDEDGRPLIVPLVQASYDLAPGMAPVLSAEQKEASAAGERWPGGDQASYRIEPAYAFHKPSTDVVLVGRARAPGKPVSELEVVFRVGPVGKVLCVTGDRRWVRVGGQIGATRPEPFSELPLRFERAFGGWDRSNPDPTKHGCEARNPIGVGYRAPEGSFEEGIALPNIEDPRDRVQAYGQAVAPAGVGFLSPDWAPRAKLAGTYDAGWSRERQPLLPRDFDRRFFNAAALVTPSHLLGGEEVLVDNASAAGRLAFRLPLLAPLRCTVALRKRADVLLTPLLDTVIVDADNHKLLLTFRAHAALTSSLHDVRAIMVESAPV